MVKEIKGYECEKCGKAYKTKEDAENCDCKIGKTHGDPIVSVNFD